MSSVVIGGDTVGVGARSRADGGAAKRAGACAVATAGSCGDAGKAASVDGATRRVDDVCRAGAGDQLVLLVDDLRLSHCDLLPAMHDAAYRAQHAGIGGHGLEEIDVKLRGREVLSREKRAEHREPHGAVGE